MYMHVCVYIYIYIYTHYMYIYIYKHIYVHRYVGCLRLCSSPASSAAGAFARGLACAAPTDPKAIS